MARWVTIVRNKFVTLYAQSYDEFIGMLEDHLNMLKEWKDKGVLLDLEGVGNDYALFYTEDEELAKELEFESEIDFFGYDDEEDLLEAKK